MRLLLTLPCLPLHQSWCQHPPWCCRSRSLQVISLLDCRATRMLILFFLLFSLQCPCTTSSKSSSSERSTLEDLVKRRLKGSSSFISSSLPCLLFKTCIYEPVFTSPRRVHPNTAVPCSHDCACLVVFPLSSLLREILSTFAFSPRIHRTPHSLNLTAGALILSL